MSADEIEIIDFGIADYEESLALQTSKFESLVGSKKRGEDCGEAILIGEHNPVITLGRRADAANILVSEDYLGKRGVALFKTGRGGDVTYHGPGQLILYPVIDLDKHRLGVKQYVDLLEETVIRLLGEYGIEAGRVEGATGVWLGTGGQAERKICAIGVKCSHFCTMHGLALNVNNSLEGFSLINPCGFTDKGVTSIKKETGREPDMEEVKKKMLHIFLSLIFPFKEILHFPEKL